MSTSKDATVAFVTMARAAASAGLDVSGWSLERGSKANGIAWKIYTPSGSTGLVGMPPYGHIGMNATEATKFLDGLTAAFATVAYLRETGKGE